MPLITTLAGASARGYGAFNISAPEIVNFDSIASTSGENLNSVTFNTIPNKYKHLQLRLNIKPNGGGTGLAMAINGGVAVTPYNVMYASNSTNAVTGAANPTNEGFLTFATLFGPSDSTPILVDIVEANSTTKFKTVRFFGGYHSNGSYTPGVWKGGWAFETTAPISSITLKLTNGQTFHSLNRLALYGIGG